MKIVSINDAPKADKLNEVIELSDKRKQEMLDILNTIREKIENGEITEFTATSLDPNGEAQIHCFVNDVAAGVGLFEIGKNILINQYHPE